MVISDNASTDRTGDICRDYASRDARIRYERQPENRGPSFNFRKVLADSRGEFFMWQAGDDLRSDDFIEANVTFLAAHPEYVASCSPVRLDTGSFDPRHVDPGACDPRYFGDGPVVGSRAERILAVVPGHHNGRFYSLYRREALLGCEIFERRFLAADWAVMVDVAAKGPLHRVERGWTLLGMAGESRSGNLYRSSRNTWLDLLLPFGVFSAHAWRRSDGFTLAQKVHLALKLVHLNAFGFRQQMSEVWHRRFS
jgi:glycosyltransferase involved in cell wall biosynthesis